jgi:hypothetical protein
LIAVKEGRKEKAASLTMKYVITDTPHFVIQVTLQGTEWFDQLTKCRHPVTPTPTFFSKSITDICLEAKVQANRDKMKSHIRRLLPLSSCWVDDAQPFDYHG